MTTFNEYQRAAVKVPVSRTTDHSPLQFPLLGLQEEVGKLASLLDISLTLNMDALTDDQTEEIRSRCGEMLWYLAHICRELNIDMEDIALRSLQELQNRAGNGNQNQPAQNLPQQ